MCLRSFQTEPLLKNGRKMKRDWDLIRKILTCMEEKPAGQNLDMEELSGNKAENFAHIKMLKEAGFLNAAIAGFQEGGGVAIVQSLTFEGYDLLDTIRNETVWNGIKKTAVQKGLDLTFDVVKMLGKALIQHMIFGNSTPDATTISV